MSTANRDPRLWGEEVALSRVPWQPAIDGDVIPAHPMEAWLGSFRPFQGGEFTCTNFVVVHTPAGATCGEVEIPTPPPPCHGATVRVTRVGTLLQFAPFFSEPGIRIRWWTGLLD